LAGYVIRLAEQNGYPTASWIFDLAGLDRINTNHHLCSVAFKSPECLRGLSRLTGISLKELARLVYARADTPRRAPLYKFFGHPVHQYVIRPLSVTLCPECLSESPYCRRVWEMSLVTTCPKHLRRLVDECPRCQKPISYIRASVCRCSCEFDFRALSAPPVSNAEAALSRRIHSLCDLNAGVPTNANGRSPVTALGLHELVSVVLFIASQHQGLSGATGKKIARGMRNAELHALYTKAYSVFEDWPSNYYEFLDWRRARERKGSAVRCGSKAGLGQDFGNFYGGLYRFFSSDEYEFLRSAFGEYLVGRWEAMYVPSLSRWKNLPRMRGSNRYVSRSEARQLLGVNYKLIDQYVEANRLTALVRGSGRERSFLIEVSSLARLKRELDHSPA
jgi:hypothetical protein